MVRQGQISDEFWAVIEPLLPTSGGRQGRPWADHRRVLEGIGWRYRTGSPWRDLPAEFGPWQTAWKRHFRWSNDGTYQKMMGAVQAAGLAEEAATEQFEQMLLSADSTIVRAHQHAAGARRDSVTQEVSALPERTGGTVELHESADRAG